MHLGYDTNEHGTRISKHRCDTCGVEFTVVPVIYPETKNWDNCLGPECSSYEPDRDVDRLFDEGKVQIVPGPPTGRA